MAKNKCPFALKISVVKITPKASENPGVIDSITITKDSQGKPYYSQLKLFADAAFWVKSKKLELRNKGFSLNDYRIFATEVAGYKRPQWLFDRIKKVLGVTVV